MQTWPWWMRVPHSAVGCCASPDKSFPGKFKVGFWGAWLLQPLPWQALALGRDCKEPTGTLFPRRQAAFSLLSAVRSPPVAGGAGSHRHQRATLSLMGTVCLSSSLERELQQGFPSRSPAKPDSARRRR